MNIKEIFQIEKAPLFEVTSEKVAYFHLFSDRKLHILSFSDIQDYDISKKFILGFSTNLRPYKKGNMVEFKRRYLNDDSSCYVILETLDDIITKSLGDKEKI